MAIVRYDTSDEGYSANKTPMLEQDGGETFEKRRGFVQKIHHMGVFIGTKD